MKIKEIVKLLEQFAPLNYQESYDNSGLIVGNPEMEVNAVLVSLDTTEEVVNEAIAIGANLIVSHHPIIFSGLKKLTGKTYVERTVIKAIENKIAIYSIHTNLDSVRGGVSEKMANLLNLSNIKILKPKTEDLLKLAFYVPLAQADQVRDAIFNAGAGKIGNYDSCSFNTQGFGTFRANSYANPFVGEKGQLHLENEVKIETIFPKYLQNSVLSALLSSHPYEEVAYDVYALQNENPLVGFGVVGFLENELSEKEFLYFLKEKFALKAIKHTPFLQKKIKKVALCGGSGSFLLRNAIAAEADVFISGDFTYHQYFDAEGKILIADIGHFESEQYTQDLLIEFLLNQFSDLQIAKTKVNTNPVAYFY
jgi:dinuclear metal center YbgI/SA1388 family protein